jgi:hypothetical protein
MSLYTITKNIEEKNKPIKNIILKKRYGPPSKCVKERINKKISPSASIIMGIKNIPHKASLVFELANPDGLFLASLIALPIKKIFINIKTF